MTKYILIPFLLINSIIINGQIADSSFFANRNIEELGLFAGYNLNVGNNNNFDTISRCK